MSASSVNQWQAVDQYTGSGTLDIDSGHALAEYLRLCDQRTCLSATELGDAALQRALCGLLPQIGTAWLIPVRGLESKHDATLALLFAHDQSTADAGRCSEQALAAVANDVAIRRAGVAQDRDLQKLAHEHWKLQATIRGTNAGTWEWNVQTGETRFNDRWAAIVGQELEDLGPVSIQTWREHTHPEDLGRSQELLQKHFAGESDFYECEARMRHRDGHWVWVLDRGEVRTWTPNGEPEWMYGTHQDITERVERERRLQQNEERLQRVSETAGVGGWELDIATGQVSWSDTTFRIYGLPIGPVPPLADCISFYAPSARPKIARAVEDAISTAQPWDLELPFIRADGEQIWVRAVGRAECIRSPNPCVAFRHSLLTVP